MRSVLLAAVLSLTFVGCKHTSSSAMNTVDISQTDFSKLGKMKRGEACLNNVLFIFAWGSNNLADLVRKTKMKKVAYLETEHHTYFIFNKHCLVAYGR